MKHQTIIKTAGVGLTIGVLTWLARSAHMLTPPQKVRIWVQYKPGQKSVVRDVLVRAGAIFHYDFGDLDSFVVSLPKGAIEQIARHPEVADYWYASMMSKNEPIVSPLP